MEGQVRTKRQPNEPQLRTRKPKVRILRRCERGRTADVTDGRQTTLSDTTNRIPPRARSKSLADSPSGHSDTSPPARDRKTTTTRSTE